MLNPAQAEAVNATDPRVLCLAAPGSGKTRVLTERAARLLLSGFHPSELTMLTFTRASAKEMRERLESRIPGKRPKFWADLRISTFHGWAASTLRAYADRLGLRRNFTIRDDDADKADLILYAARELGKCPAPGAPKRPRQWTSVRRLWQEEDVRLRYGQLLREAHAVDYDGLEFLLLKLLEQDDVAAEIRRLRIHVLVDEGQDTSAEQQAILDKLASANLFIVGDHAQSIYGFRGADVAGFVGLGAREGWRTIKLPTNYRSLQPIVDAATWLGAAMGTPGLEQDAARGGGDKWTLAEMYADSREILAESIRSDILACFIGDDEASAKGWRDMAILAPEWRLLDELAPVLEAAGIPHVVARRAGLVWDTEPARWLINCLRVAVNPEDHLALYAALTAFSPRVRLGEWAGMRARAMRGEASILGLACEVEALLPIAGCIARLRDQVAAAGWPDAADTLVQLLRDELTRLRLAHRVTELGAVETAICTWGDERTEAGESWGIADLLDWYSGRLVTDATAETTVEDRVTLTTVHGAKGLEWRAVWVLGCEEGILPRAGTPAGIEEARRLFYVAVTRGMDRVRMCWTREAARSRFVGEALGPLVADEPETPPPVAIDPDLPF